MSKDSIDLGYYEALALHRALLEAKFHTMPNDEMISGSPIIADLSAQVRDILISSEEGNQWKDWFKLCNRPDRKKQAILRIKADKQWDGLDTEEKRTKLKNYVEPFLISDVEADEMIAEIDKPMNDTDQIEALIKKSMMEMLLLCDAPESKVSSRIIIPNYSDETRKNEDEPKRYSEQELKCIFLNKIEQETRYFYSIETPTKKGYRFSGEECASVNINGEQTKNHRSGLVDVSIYKTRDISSLISHIEFKYSNCKQEDIEKDLLKLLVEGENEKNYFVHYVKNGNAGTLQSIKDKYQKSIHKIESELEKKQITPQWDKVKIFLLIVDSKKFVELTINNHEIEENKMWN